MYLFAIVPGLIFMACLEWQSSQNPFGARRFTLFDDAMISMDYARTLARTGELVWFPGAPRVQGFTNPLWTLWMALIHLFGFNGSAAALIVSLSGVLLILASSWLVLDLIVTYADGDNRLVATIAAASLPFLYPLTYWTLRGMEVGLLTFLCLLVLRGTIKHIQDHNSRVHYSLFVPMILGIATRFDFAVFCAVVTVSLFVWGENKSKTRLAMHCGLIVVATAIGVCLIQKLYWGSWLPNTYHLKMDGVSPISRISRGLVSSTKAMALFSIVVIAVVSQLRSKTPHQRIILIASAMFISMAAYAIYIGGDAWEGEMLNRFYATVLPIVILIIGMSFNAIKRRIVPLIVALVVIITTVGAGVAVNPFGFSEKHFYIAVAASILCAVIIALSSFATRDGYVASAVIIATCILVSAYPVGQQYKNRDLLSTRTNLFVTESVETLRNTTTQDARIGTVWAGVPAYYSERTMLDLLGKNDTFIAASSPHGSFFPGHNKWDYDYSIGTLRPDVIFQTFHRALEKNLHERIINWGYQKLCPRTGTFGSRGYYYLTKSPYVKWDTLEKCS